jgi:DNA modification methylase
VLRDSGTLWCNLGDSYGSGKQLLGIPWRVAFALQADSWYLRADVIWHKPNPMPESVTDRPTKAHEYVFLLTKSARYFYDAQAVSEKAVAADFVTRYRNVRSGKSPNNKDRNDAATNMTGGFMSDDPTTRNRRSVWTISTRPYSGAHFATMPPELARVCVLAGSRPGDTVLDPFAGSGTTGMVALENGREFVGIELNAEYISLAHQRIAPAQAKRAAMLPFHEVTQ